MQGNSFIFMITLFYFNNYAYAQLFLNVSYGSSITDIVITFNDLKLFEQTESSIIFSLGHGTTDYQESLGNFIINDTIATKVPLLFFEIIEDSETFINIKFKSLKSKGNSTVDFSLTVGNDTDGEENLLITALTTVSASENINRMWMYIYGEANERVYGAGEQFTYLNLKNHSFPIWTSEQGIGRDNSLVANASNLDGGAGGAYYTTYWPSATFLSSRGYFTMISNHNYLILDFEASAMNTIYVHATQIDATFLFGSNISQMVPKIARTLGMQPGLPDWVMTGATLGLEGIEGGTTEVLQQYEDAKRAGVNISALWIQDWSGTTETPFGHRVYWNWKWNETYYKNLDATIQDLLTEGVKMTVYINPHFIVGSDMYNEADSLGLLMTEASGSSYQYDFGGFLAGTLNVFDETARIWFKDQMVENIIGLNIYGWMADFGEYTPLDMYSSAAENMTQEEVHNSFPIYWAQVNNDIREAALDILGDEVVYYMRSGSLESTRYQMLNWGGDQNVDFSCGDGLPSTIVAALSMSLNGMGLSHFDIGGYTTQPPLLTRSRELLLRSAEYAVFTPIMRTHLGNKPDKNWQVYSSQDTLLDFGRLSRIHALLFPYTQHVVQENTECGIPAQRPMFYHYEDDSNTWDIQYQYMYGEDLIVGPVLEEGQMTVDLYVPEGDNSVWFHIWGGLGYVGGPYSGPATITLNAPIGLPAVLFRNDSDFRDLFLQINTKFGPTNP